jgi:N6-adenosine-specific RNA methylase IME4
LKGKACSWRDIRRIKHILENAERLKGEMSALTNCVDKSTLSTWRRQIEVMDAMTEALGPKFTYVNLSPSHAREIARHSPRESWPEWVDSCEKSRWTVAQLRSVLLAAKAAETHALAERSIPTGKYSSIVVDPPWSYSNKSGRHGDSANAGYIQDRTMTLDEVALFDIKRWTAETCHLYLWVTDAYVGHIYEVTEAWGFDAKATLVWVKDRIGMGNYYRHQHELCVFAVKGKMRLARMNASTVFSAPITTHSEKPDEFYRLVESCSPGPYLDVFARKKRAGWDVFGDEVTNEYQLNLNGPKESVQIR